MFRNEQQHDKYNVPEVSVRWNELRTAVHDFESVIFNANSPYREVGQEALRELQPNTVPSSQAANQQSEVAPVADQPEDPALAVYAASRPLTAAELAQQQVAEAYANLEQLNVKPVVLPTQSIAELDGVDANV